MEKYYYEFVSSLKKFVENLNRYVPNQGCSDFIQYFDQLKMGKVMLRYLNKMRKYETELKNRDELMFKDSLEILPNIDLHILWPQLKTGQKNKLWTIMQILYIQSELLLNNSETKDNTSQKNKVLNQMIDNIGESNPEKTTENKDIDNKYELTINPYIGILPESHQTSGYSMNEMFSGPELLPGDNPTSSGIFGNLGNLLDVEKLSEELKNMTPDQIDEATNNIKSLLGDADEKTTEVIHTMLKDIQNELKTAPSDTSDPWGFLGKISERVAQNLHGKLDDDGVVMSNLINSTQKLGNCKDANGNPIFGGTMNPFNMLQGLIGKMSGMQMPGSVNPPPTANTPSPQDMLKEMGLQDFDLNNVGPDNMAAMQQQIFKNVKGMNMQNFMNPQKKKQNKNKKR